MKNINIAEILKDCPKGTKLYSPIFGDVYLEKIRPHLAIVVTIDKKQGDFKEEFLYNGRYGMNGECMLFPSKENRDWSTFQRPFKDEKTKTLEKLIVPKFKVGDTVKRIDNALFGIISLICGDEYRINLEKGGITYIPFKHQNNYELVLNKFDISMLKPFESKVLVRSYSNNLWKPAIFGFYEKTKLNPYFTVGGNYWACCIPYNDDTKHLLGTTNDCDEYYKNW